MVETILNLESPFVPTKLLIMKVPQTIKAKISSLVLI